MGLKRALSNSWFSRIALITSIISAIAVYFLLTRIDLIVHGQLYYFGLRFDAAWGDAYRILMWVIYACLVLPMVLSSVMLVASFTRKETQKELPKIPEKKSESVQKVDQTAKLQIAGREELKTTENGHGNTMVISCPNCQRVFSRPLVMLDFAGGTPKLVNVCPYCNHHLGNAKNEKCADSGFSVPDANKKLTT
jgi:uncharacterized Zn-finger protein